MRIISKFQDYYDCGQKYGFDPQIVYHRVTEGITSGNTFKQLTEIYKQFPKSYHGNEYQKIESTYFRTLLAIVCGKLYIGYYLGDKGYSENAKISYDIDTITNFMEANEAKMRKYKYRWYKPITDVQKLFNACQFIKNIDFTKICLDLKSPIVIVELGYTDKVITVTKDQFLKDYDFVKVLEPYVMYQELSMFVGNYMIEQSKPIWPVSDVLKAQSKGFDKWSFRKQSTGRK